MFEELIQLACKLANQARVSTGQPVLIAGSLAPLRGSFRPDLVGDPDEITPVFQEQVIKFLTANWKQLNDRDKSGKIKSYPDLMMKIINSLTKK